MMTSVNPFSAHSLNTPTLTSQSLDSMMRQQLSSQPAGQIFQPTNEETPAPTINAKEKFLQRYAQAIANGEFILSYDSDPKKMNKQFAKDLALLYQLMLPAEEDKEVLKPPVLAEMENWLIALVPKAPEKPAEGEPPAPPPTDEQHFLTLAFNNFQLVYRKNWEKMFDQIKAEAAKPLSVDWEQGLAKPDWPFSDGEYTPTASPTNS